VLNIPKPDNLPPNPEVQPPEPLDPYLNYDSDSDFILDNSPDSSFVTVCNPDYSTVDLNILNISTT